MLFKVIVILASGLSLQGCGVKGDPLPPEDAPKLGRGNPTFTRAVDELEIDKASILEEPANTDDQEESDENP